MAVAIEEPIQEDDSFSFLLLVIVDVVVVLDLQGSPIPRRRRRRKNCQCAEEGRWALNTKSSEFRPGGLVRQSWKRDSMGSMVLHLPPLFPCGCCCNCSRRRRRRRRRTVSISQ